MAWVVYWLFDDRCVCPWSHGYIGISGRIARRLNQHRESGRFPNFEVRILFNGPKNDCLALEAKLRPRPSIGWNVGVGGYVDGRGTRGISKSPEHRERMRAAALRRYADPVERARTRVVVKEAFRHIDRSGSNNAMFGKHMSETAKQKIRDRITERGGIAGAKNPNWRGGSHPA
jgi:hypothetical protein